jgi:hypothetical protein
MNIETELNSKIELIKYVRFGRSQGYLPNNMEVLLDIDEIPGQIGKVMSVMVRNILTNCYTRINPSYISIRLDEEVFNKIRDIEDFVYIGLHSSPKLVNCIAKVRQALNAFEDSRIRNGKQFIYIDITSGNINSARMSIDLILRLKEELDSLDSIYEEHINDINEFKRQTLEKAKQLEEARAQFLNDNLPNTQEKLENAWTQKTANDYLKVKSKIRIIKLNQQLYAFPPEIELAPPSGARVIGSGSVAFIVKDQIKTLDGDTLFFNINHWTPLDEIYKEVRAPGLYYEPSKGKFCVVVKQGQEYWFDYESAIEFIEANKFDIDCKYVIPYNGNEKINITGGEIDENPTS